MCFDSCFLSFFFFFFFNDTATTEIYTLSLHDALPISSPRCQTQGIAGRDGHRSGAACSGRDRKSTRLNSSHLVISYAVFCLKKKNKPSARTHTCSNPLSCTEHPVRYVIAVA